MKRKIISAALAASVFTVLMPIGSAFADTDNRIVTPYTVYSLDFDEELKTDSGAVWETNTNLSDKLSVTKSSGLRLDSRDSANYAKIELTNGEEIEDDTATYDSISGTSEDRYLKFSPNTAEDATNPNTISGATGFNFNPGGEKVNSRFEMSFDFRIGMVDATKYSENPMFLIYGFKPESTNCINVGIWADTSYYTAEGFSLAAKESRWATSYMLYNPGTTTDAVFSYDTWYKVKMVGDVAAKTVDYTICDSKTGEVVAERLNLTFNPETSTAAGAGGGGARQMGLRLNHGVKNIEVSYDNFNFVKDKFVAYKDASEYGLYTNGGTTASSTFTASAATFVEENGEYKASVTVGNDAVSAETANAPCLIVVSYDSEGMLCGFNYGVASLVGKTNSSPDPGPTTQTLSVSLTKSASAVTAKAYVLRSMAEPAPYCTLELPVVPASGQSGLE